jgi:hypothetical protein
MCGRIVVEVTAESTVMNTSLSAAQVEQLRRKAKRLGRTLSIPHSEALYRIAAQHGFRNWSLLSKHSTPGAAPRGALPPAPPLAPAPRPEPPDSHRRYYLHGDQFEDDPSRYYCAQCDVFFDAPHFASHGRHTGERFLERLERWNKRDWRSRMGTGAGQTTRSICLKSPLLRPAPSTKRSALPSATGCGFKAVARGLASVETTSR